MSMRIAVIGTGYFSQFHYDAWRRLDVDVVGVCDLDLARASDIARTFPNAEAFDDAERMIAATAPGLIDIVTPPPTHFPLIELAQAHGIPAICQKPFCGDLETARRAAAMSVASGIPVIVHENFRYQPWYVELKRLIEAGTFGDLYQAMFRLRPGDGQGADAYLARQPYFRDMPRFLVQETLVHMIDVFRFLFGDVQSISADLRRLNPAIKGEDDGILILTFESGIRGVIDGNRLADHAAENRRLVMGEMTIDGSNAVATLNGDGDIGIRDHGSNDVRAHAYDWTNTGFGGDCVYHLIKDVLEKLRAGEMLANTASDYIKNLELVAAAYRAHEERCTIDV